MIKDVVFKKIIKMKSKMFSHSPSLTRIFKSPKAADSLCNDIWLMMSVNKKTFCNNIFQIEMQLGRASLNPPDSCSKWGDFSFIGRHT